MTDVTDGGTPAEAIHAAAVVIHRSRCAASCQHRPDRVSVATAMVALEAAAPFIAARAAAAQLEADIKLARDVQATYWDPAINDSKGGWRFVADLLAAAPEETP